MMQYIIAKSSNLCDLKNRINKCIKNGFFPRGNLTPVNKKTGLVFIQVMTKEDKQKITPEDFFNYMKKRFDKEDKEREEYNKKLKEFPLLELSKEDIELQNILLNKEDKNNDSKM